MTSDHRYALTGAIVAPVVDPDYGVVLGMATIYPDGKIEAQLHSDMGVDLLRNLLIANLADGITILPRLIPETPTREVEKHDSSTNS